MKKEGLFAKPAGFRKLTETAVSGLHYLAYLLTLDPAEEIRGAVEDARSKNWQELPSIDKILEEAPASEIEAAVEQAPVVYKGNEASYRIDAAPVQENYKDSGYKAPSDNDDDAEVSYSSEQETAKVYDQELDAQMFANVWKQEFKPIYATAEMAERMENYKLSIGLAASFLNYAMKSATF